MANLTKSTEDYLETIYLIKKENKVVRVKEIANFLDISLPSVSEAIKKLNKLKLVENEKYGYINLTKKGEIAGRNVYKKHKLLLDFLNKILKVNKNIALKDACALEHCLSNETTKKLKKFVSLKLKKGGN